MSEPTRPLPPPSPLPGGGWAVDSFTSSTEYKIMGLALVPADRVVPVIFVPGIMGTNLRAKRTPRPNGPVNEKNTKVAPGGVVWRPPNGMKEGLNASDQWKTVSPADRQRLFDGPTLEVDDRGAVMLEDAAYGYVLTAAEARARGWGEVHADSYGALLDALEIRLNHTFEPDYKGNGSVPRKHWQDVMACPPAKWGLREFEPLTLAHLKKHAQYNFPVYAVGYNWLDDCEESSRRRERRILEIIAFWTGAKRRCDRVILVTHSMGGLVARACARRIPDKIAGVIHGVMPALGAPAAYRRLACGTENSSPDNGPLDDLAASRLALILGETTEKTTPVLATSSGALELLPNHLYPGPWLHVRVMTGVERPPASSGGHTNVGGQGPATRDCLHLPNAKSPNPYDLYRDMNPWYRLVNPALADPAGKYTKTKNGAEKAIIAAIGTAERFHRSLGDYYHPNTYAFYGEDQHKRAYGQVRWVAWQQAGGATAVTAANVGAASFLGHTALGQRRVRLEGKADLLFALEQQDARGDGTVPHQSGTAPRGKVRQVFATQGYDHQGSYKHPDMLMLTLRLVVKIVQEMP
jgi:pimeloyl-ACP methyl ester carboxylesterase